MLSGLLFGVPGKAAFLDTMGEVEGEYGKLGLLYEQMTGNE